MQHLTGVDTNMMAASGAYLSSARFVVACATALVAFGGFWRLPYLLTTYGGSAFLVVYLLAVLLMGWPVVAAQIFLASGTGADLPGVIARWTATPPHSRLWAKGAYLALFGTFLLLVVYVVMVSWLLAYDMHAFVGRLEVDSLVRSTSRFAAFVHDGERGLGWSLLVVIALLIPAASGVKRGVAPTLCALGGLLLTLLLFSLTVTIAYVGGGRFPSELFELNFSALGLRGIGEALFQAFFSLSLGTGVIMAFAGRLGAQAPVFRLSAAVIGISQIMTLGLALMAAEIAAPNAGLFDMSFQWVFEKLPVIMVRPRLLALVLLLLLLVGLTTAMGLFEVLVQAVEKRFKVTRLRAAVWLAIVVAVVAVVLQSGFSMPASWRVFGDGLFGWFVRLGANFILPLTCLFFVILVSSVIARSRLDEYWGRYVTVGSAVSFELWYLLLRYPARLGLIIVVAYALGIVGWMEAFWGGNP